MSTEKYRFKIGSFECIAVSDGTYSYPHPAQNVFINFFVNAPKERLKSVLRRHNLDPDTWEQYVSPYTCLVIKNDQNCVLIDTGAGSFAPTTGKLIPNLKTETITPEDIDTVILTHGHPDHIGGNIDTEGKPAFPNARYVMWKDEWDFWTSEPNLDELNISDHGKELLVEIAQKNLLPIRDRLELIERKTEIISGIHAIAAPGHTPGHMAVTVKSNDEQLLHVSDMVLHPIHLEQPDWHSAVAYTPEKVVTTRYNLLNKAVSEKALMFATHFPFPSMGYIVQKEEVYQWQPI